MSGLTRGVRDRFSKLVSDVFRRPPPKDPRYVEVGYPVFNTSNTLSKTLEMSFVFRVFVFCSR